MPRAAAWVPVLLNVVWAIDCIVVVETRASVGTMLVAFMAIQIVTVLAFAELEFMGLRRSLPLAA